MHAYSLLECDSGRDHEGAIAVPGGGVAGRVAVCAVSGGPAVTAAVSFAWRAQTQALSVHVDADFAALLACALSNFAA